MEVEYQNTIESLATLRRVVLARERKRLLLLTLMYVLLVGIPPSMVFLALECWPAILAGWALIGLVLILLFWLARKSLANMMQSFLDRGMPVCRLRISPEVFLSNDEWGWSRRDWSTIESIVTTHDHLLIFIDQATAHVVPFSAFDSMDEAKRFAELCEQYRQAAGQSEQARFQAPPAPKAADGIQLQATFLPSQEDKAAVLHTADEQRDQDMSPPGKKQSSAGSTTSLLFSLILIACGVLALSIWDPNRLPTGTQALIGGFTVIIWSITVLFADRRVRLWLAKRSARGQELLTTVTISPAGLMLTTPVRESFSSWRTWEEIRNARSFILFCTVKQHIALIVPKRAFDTPEAAEQFAGATKQFWETARQQEHSGAIVEVVRDDDNNPYQSPFG